jgi:membrane-bound ClpP family serine protease
MKRSIKDWFMILVLLSDEAAVVVLIFLALRFFKVEMPLVFTVVIAVFLAILVFIAHMAIIPTFHKKRVTGSEGMIGLSGTVVEPLAPVGVVKVGGEYWKAKSTAAEIDAGQDVEILAATGLVLTVRVKDH